MHSKDDETEEGVEVEVRNGEVLAKHPGQYVTPGKGGDALQ